MCKLQWYFLFIPPPLPGHESLTPKSIVLQSQSQSLEGRTTHFYQMVVWPIQVFVQFDHQGFKKGRELPLLFGGIIFG